MSHAPRRSVCVAKPLAGSFLRRVAALRSRRNFWWLDSALVKDPLGRFSFAGAEPRAVLRAWGRRVVVDVAEAPWAGLRPGRHEHMGDPLEALRALLPPSPEEDPAPGLPFRGGAVGVLGYELAPLLPPLASLVLRGQDETGLPDACFLLVDRVVAHDHQTGRTLALGLGEGESRGAAREQAVRALRGLVQVTAHRDLEAEALLARDWRTAVAAPVVPVESQDQATHAKAVLRVKEHIAEGDCYQACLTHRLDSPFRGDSFALSAALRSRSPAPFAAHLELPGASVISSSPERFLQVGRDARVESRPIKGTRARGCDPTRDRAARHGLETSAKDRAENLMIVDLVRNDLGRVCRTGSVHVPELMVVEAYEGLFQMVSTIRGELAPRYDRFDAIRASFPPGSMTGAPKLAAMERLTRLEPLRRGFYAGAIGYLDVCGGADLSVVIRTALLIGDRAHVHTGGGIVADSEPDAEWQEAADKARPLLEAIALASS